MAAVSANKLTGAWQGIKTGPTSPQSTWKVGTPSLKPVPVRTDIKDNVPGLHMKYWDSQKGWVPVPNAGLNPGKVYSVRIYDKNNKTVAALKINWGINFTRTLQVNSSMGLLNIKLVSKEVAGSKQLTMTSNQQVYFRNNTPSAAKLEYQHPTKGWIEVPAKGLAVGQNYKMRIDFFPGNHVLNSEYTEFTARWNKDLAVEFVNFIKLEKVRISVKTQKNGSLIAELSARPEVITPPRKAEPN